MYYVDMPSAEDIGALNLVRSDACISIYLPTTPVSRETEQSRKNLSNIIKRASAQLEKAGLSKQDLALLQEQFADLIADDDFWNYQANSLAILATPESIRTYRMASKLSEVVEISDRFHLNPLLRAVTFPHAAYVLALSENAVRLIEVSADLPAREVVVQNLPTDAASSGGKAADKNYTGTGHRHGAQGQNFYLTRFVRKVDTALRPVLVGSEHPLILAAAKPLEALFRSISSISALPNTIAGNPERLSESDLAAAARPILDEHYAEQIKDFHRLFEERTGQQRTTTDISDAARLATFGGIDRLLVDIDGALTGRIDDETGIISYAAEAEGVTYNIVDEITGRALRTGAKVMAVRAEDIPNGQQLAVISRYPI